MKYSSSWILFYWACFHTTLLFSQARVTRTESFDVPGGAAAMLPFGWSGSILNGSDPNNFADRVTTGGSPTCATHSGAGMMRYRSGLMASPVTPEQYFVASPRYDLTNNPGTATISFWMYKDNMNTVKDSVSLYMNDSAVANLSRGSMTKVMGPFSHDTTIGGVGWKQYTAVIPAGYNNSSAFVIFVFTNKEPVVGGANIFVDDFSIETYPKKMNIISSSLFYQETAGISVGSIDQLIVGIKVVTDGAADSLRIDSIVTNATGTTILTSIVPGSCKIWYTKGNSTFTATGNQFGSGMNPTYFRDKFTQTAPYFFLENGENYFWVTISVSAAAPLSSFIDIDFNGIYYHDLPYSTLPDSSVLTTVSTLPGSRRIGITVCNGIIPIMIWGGCWFPGNYPTDYINRVYLRGGNSVIPSYPYIDNNINDVGPWWSPWFSGPAPLTAHPPDYQLFSQTPSTLHPNITAVLAQGMSYAAPAIVASNPTGAGLALQSGAWTSNNYLAAWIDYNQDGDFLDGTGIYSEKVAQSGPVGTFGWWTVPVNVPLVLTAPTPNVAGPSGIQYGNTIMRVREVFGINNIQPCLSGYVFGEIEDYVVSIIPACPLNVSLWLGYTDDWNTPANWCGGVPTINDVALIDEVNYLGGTQSGAPYDPVIHSGTIATAKSIRLGTTDTLTINATTNSSLTIADSLAISYNTPAGGSGLLKVISAFSDTAQLSNGNLGFNISPFKPTRKESRSQFLYTKSELISKGMIAGDVIDQLIFYFNKTSGVSHNFNGFTIKYATCDSMWAKWTAPPTQLAPNTSAYVTVYSANPLNINLPASGGTVTLNMIPGKFIWNGVSDIVLEICYDNAFLPSLATDDVLMQTQTTGSWQFLNINTSAASPSGCSLGLPAVSPALAIAYQYKPNITFHFKRPYIKYPINITGNGAVTAGHWINYGAFSAGQSHVTFNNNMLNQRIGGISQTTFNEVTIDKAGGPGNNGVMLDINASIDSIIHLTNGALLLNQKTLWLKNSSSAGTNAAIARTNGWIQSEDLPPAYGNIRWTIGTDAMSHVFPLGTADGTYIPFTLTNATGGDVGDVTIATYPTAPDNTPWPPTVTHLNDLATGINKSIVNVVDRFWNISKTGPSGNPMMTFGWTVVERPTCAACAADNALMPQKWESPNGNGNDGWRLFAPPPIHSFVNNTSTLNPPGIPFNGIWTITNFVEPLPVELLQFDAKLIEDKVKIWWSTASETDNDYFTVERTTNYLDYDFIAEVNSKGPGTHLLDYITYDEAPLPGLQYYRLKDTDFTGNSKYSKLVPVRYEKTQAFEIKYVLINKGSSSIDVVFHYNTNEPYSYSLVDMMGKAIATKSGNAASPGLNTLTIPVDMTAGVYLVVIRNAHEEAEYKIVY